MNLTKNDFNNFKTTLPSALSKRDKIHWLKWFYYFKSESQNTFHRSKLISNLILQIIGNKQLQYFTCHQTTSEEKRKPISKAIIPHSNS